MHGFRNLRGTCGQGSLCPGFTTSCKDEPGILDSWLYTASRGIRSGAVALVCSSFREVRCRSLSLHPVAWSCCESEVMKTWASSIQHTSTRKV